MRLLKKIAYACCSVTFGLLTLTGCTDGKLYDVNAPDWISDKIQEIEDSKKQPEDEVLEGMQEDVYTIGNTDFTSGWWSTFSKYYVVPDGEKWNAVFNLHINPTDNTYFKNYALVVTNDVDRGGTGYTEYGAIRFDATNDSIAYNSQWGKLYFKYTIQGRKAECRCEQHQYPLLLSSRRFLHRFLANQHRPYRWPYICSRQESGIDGTAGRT